MNKFMMTVIFTLGLVAVGWVGWGFVGTSWMALAMTAVIGGVYVLGALELRRFRAATGLKPTQYCQLLRIGKAREMLEFTNSTIDHIAWNVGYADPGAFRATFKKITGLAPSDYRNRFGVSPAAVAR